MSDDGLDRRAVDQSSGDRPDGDGLRALLLIEIAQFAQWRRAVGVEQSGLLALHVAEVGAAALPQAVVMTVGRDMVEMRLIVNDAAALDRAVQNLRAAAERPAAIDPPTLPLRLHIGAALSSACPGDDVRLAEAAEEALDEARRAGHATSVAPEPVIDPDDARVCAELLNAVTHDELFVQYQPKLHLRRQAITSIEALIRWAHPTRGLVLPNDFIPAAERSGAIKALTLWTLRRVIADQRRLDGDGHALPVFVNIAGVLLSDRGFVDEACRLVEESGARLGFEITETSVIREPEAAIEHLNRLAAIGVAIAIDDYGAGLSSLAYLKKLPATELKIDKLFVTQLASSHRDPLIVRSTIDLAHALDMEVVAEGVETPTSLALLSVMGCDMVQGFLLSRPMGLDGLMTFLREERHRGLLDQSRSPLQRMAAVRARV